MDICAPLKAQFNPCASMGTVTCCKHISAFFWELYFVFLGMTNILLAGFISKQENEDTSEDISIGAN